MRPGEMTIFKRLVCAAYKGSQAFQAIGYVVTVKNDKIIWDLYFNHKNDYKTWAITNNETECPESYFKNNLRLVQQTFDTFENNLVHEKKIQFKIHAARKEK